MDVARNARRSRDSLSAANSKGHTLEGLLFWAAGCLAAICIGLAKGGIPASGALAVPILSLVVSPVAAAGLLLPVLVVSDIFGVYAYRRAFDRRVLGIAMVGIIIGTGIGWATAHLVSDDFVRVLIGLIALVFALNFLLRRPDEGAARKVRRSEGVFWTTVAGFTSFVSHAGAPPWQVWVQPLGLTKEVFAGTTVLAFAFMNALKIIPYIALGQLQLENLKTTAILMIPAVCSVYIGVRLVKLLPERTFFTIVTWMLLLIGLRLIWDGVTG